MPGVASKAGPVFVIGTETLTVTEVTSPTTLVTIGHTFTIVPPGGGDSTEPYPTFVVIGTETATLPSVSEATTIVTLDSTFTLLPPTSISPTPGSTSPPDETSPPDSPATSNATHAPTGPQLTASMPSEITSPASNPPSPSLPSLSLTNSGLISKGSIVAIIGTETLHLPSVSLDSTVTTKGRTITLVSGGPPTITIVETSQEPSSTGPSSTADLVTFTTWLDPAEPDLGSCSGKAGDLGRALARDTWPPQALITPVEISVKKPEPSADEESAVIPCSLWFFSLCIRFNNINILGWKVILPPGIYPPQLRLDQIIKLPQSISIRGELPPWPKFTVGNDHVPTFPSEPEPTKCETKTASLCATTTPWWQRIGLLHENQRRQDGMRCYSNYNDGLMHTGTERKQQAAVNRRESIYAEIQKMLPDGGEIEISAVRGLRVNFWLVHLYPDQAESVRMIPSVASVYRPCGSDCSDPTLQDSKISWRYQNQYVDEQVDAFEDHTAQMSYISANEGSKDDRWNQRYYFDVSAGEDVPVYIVDTGATMDHIEFNLRDKIASKTEFIFVGKDFDGQQHRDDSYIPEGGRCPPVGLCKPHGTSMLSIIAGAKIGIAKKAKPIMVHVPRRRKEGGGAKPRDWIDAMSAVANAFSDKSATTRAILCMAQGHRFEDFKMDWESRNKEEGQDKEKLLSEAWILFRKSMHEILTDLVAKGVFIVTGAGTDGVSCWSWERLILVMEVHILVANGNRNEWPETSRVEGANAEKRQNGNKKSHYKFSQGTSDATAYTAGLAAYFLKLHQLGRLGPDKKGNQPDMSPAGLKRYIINNGWVRQNKDNNGVLGIWNGATIESLEREGFCPYIAGTTNIFRLRRQEGAALTGQCVPGTSPTASAGSTHNPSATATPTGSGTVAPTAIPTTFVCTEETADKCAPGVVCSRPRVNGCVDGKCVCVLPDLPAPTSFVCPERTADKCAPGVTCSAPQTNGCVDGQCVCVLPDLPSKTTVVQTTLSTVTSKSPDPVPTNTEMPVALGERKCHDASIYTGQFDIQEHSVFLAAKRACSTCVTRKASMSADSLTRNGYPTEGGIRYEMEISWRSNCVSTVETIDCGDPLGENPKVHTTPCENLFVENWKSCTANKGRGGYIDVGCLRYDFTPM
ncbi:hypothetical protein CCHR01_04970 [Colletotrichum chrysophilum]|uniref:Subtilisin n=1 Tax=Colletotrichum chrysophilum TaxID=1836956 RepID=A0AAD9AVC7_9PEZI|nr:hypothetical protein CCHR01_04970 [Colletotrichum chrysophilum]